MKQNNIFFRYFSPVAAQQKLYAAALVALLSSSAYEAEAQVGEPFIHDPSTIALCDGKYYTFGTGEGKNERLYVPSSSEVEYHACRKGWLSGWSLL